MFEGFVEKNVAVAEAQLFCLTGGAGPPLLLLHGYPQTHVCWHRVAPRLMRHFSLVIPDLRGYGQSRGPRPDPEHRNYSKRAMATDMAELMTALGHQQFFVAGHDRGARVGFRLALDQPARVRRLAAIDIIPTLDVWTAIDADKALASYHWMFLAVPAPLPETLISADPDFYIRHLLDRWVGRPDALHEQAVAAYLHQFHDPAVVAATCEDYRAGASIDREEDAEDRRRGAKLACPVLVMWGSRYLSSRAGSPLAVWRNWADDAREVAIDCGHFVAEEAPEDCNAALTAFFSEARS
jgi:haloacetate dehalogenase